MKYKKNTAIKLIMTIGGIGLLSSLFVGLNNSFTNPLAVSAQVKPSSINVVNLNDTQVNSYYDGVDGLSGDALLSTLNGIIDDHREYNYNSDTDRYSYKIIDRNWDIDPLNSSQLSNFDYVNDNGFIRKFYADYNDSVSTADRYKNVGATRVSFDKEHVWAQSLGNFGRDDGAGSDFHSLVPADIKGNSPMHSNYNFATPTSSITNYNNDYETYVGRNGYISGSSQKVCEPLDEYKGDIARAMFYMPARYYTWVDITHPKLTLVNGSPAAVTASESQPGLAGDLATLLQWNELDPVDEYEIHRNNLIYNNFQLNRNPFIDHPEWARIAYDTSYSGSGASTASGTSSVGSNPDVLVQSITLNATSHNMNINDEFTLSATINPVNAGNKTLTWASSVPSVASVSNGLITGLSVGNTTITATANDGSGIFASCTISVSSLILESISLSGVVSTTSYASTYYTSSIIVTAHYDDESSGIVTSEASIGIPNTHVLGEQAVNVSYLDKTVSYSVTVTNNGSANNLNKGFASDLIISEYIEGSSYNKVLEIYNGTGQTVALSNYAIKLFSNGSTTASSTKTFTGGETLANDSVLSLVYSSATSNFKVGTFIESAVVNYNGDDAIGLYKNDALIDLIGIIGEDPGTEWTGQAANGAGSTLNRTLVRVDTIVSPNILFSFSEWNCYATDTSSYLGFHSMTPPPNITDLDQANAWAEYFLIETSSQCEALEPQSEGVWTTLENEYNWMSSIAKGYYASSESSIIIDAIARYNAIITAHSENESFITELVPGAQTFLANDDAWENIVIVLLTITALSVICLFFYDKKRRMNQNT